MRIYKVLHQMPGMDLSFIQSATSWFATRGIFQNDMVSCSTDNGCPAAFRHFSQTVVICSGAALAYRKCLQLWNVFPVLPKILKQLMLFACLVKVEKREKRFSIVLLALCLKQASEGSDFAWN